MNNLQKIPTFSVCRLSKLAIIGLLLSTASFANAAEITDETTQQDIHSNPDPISDVADSISKEVEQEQQGDANQEQKDEPPKIEEERVEEEKPQEATKLIQEDKKEEPTQTEEKREETPKQDEGKQENEKEVLSKFEEKSEKIRKLIQEKEQELKDKEDQPVMSVVDTAKHDNEDDRGDDYVEESDRPDGTHIRKEVHRGPGGSQTVRMQISGGAGMPGMMRGRQGPGGLMAAIMQDMAKQMGKAAQEQNKDKKQKGGEVIRMEGPMGSIVVRKQIPHDDDDEDDKEDGIPPEIVQMMKMTEAMHRRHMMGMMGGMMGGPSPRHLQLQKKKENKEEDNTPRIEESHADIMAKMNKLSEEIGEKHDKDKLGRMQTSKNNRLKQVIMVAGILIVIMVASFALTCIASKKKDDDDQNEKEDQPDEKRSRVGKSD